MGRTARKKKKGRHWWDSEEETRRYLEILEAEEREEGGKWGMSYLTDGASFYNGGKQRGWRVKNSENNNVECSLCKPPTIYIEFIPRQKIELLMEEYKSQEWIGYLVGQENKDSGDLFVDDVRIPPHKEAHGTSAEAEPFHIPDNCIGIIHSHHSMDAFHSATDKQYVDKNYPVSITVAKKGANLEYDAISYQTTPCGKRTVGKCKACYVSPEPMFDTKAFLKEAKENIDKSKKVFTAAIQTYPQRGYLAPYMVNQHGVVMTQKEYEELISDINNRDYSA